MIPEAERSGLRGGSDIFGGESDCEVTVHLITTAMIIQTEFQIY